MRSCTASFWIVATLLIAALALFAGCGEETSPVQTAPAAESDPFFTQNACPGGARGLWARYFPLRTGNHWRYDRQFRAWDDAGHVIADLSGVMTRRLLGQEEWFGTMYEVEEVRITDETTSRQWIRYRQDRDGLYEADISIFEPPKAPSVAGKEIDREATTASAAAGTSALAAAVRDEKDPIRREALAAHFERHRRLAAAALFGMDPAAAPTAATPPDYWELTRLAYPLRRGQSWVILYFPLLTSVAEGRELLRLPIGPRVGMRVRITPPLPGTEDAVLLWYNSCGLLRLYIRVRSQFAGLDGSPLVTIFTEEIVELVEADVQGRPWCGR